MLSSFYNNRSVLITGHTGFKGTWLSQILLNMGADVTGVALEPLRSGIFQQINLPDRMQSIIGDIRTYSMLYDVFQKSQPEIVFHLAAQPLVIDSYDDPKYTFETNIMGTVNLLECVRHCESVKSVVIITTDKVYQNNEWVYGYRETDSLGGADPYSASKACAELVVSSYKKSFFKDLPVSTVRAGNVIGGGDVSGNRIIPDCIRAVSKSEEIFIRNPASVRPYQHVLEPLFAYLLLAEKQYNNPELSDCYNIGPEFSDCINTKDLVELFCKTWGHGAKWRTAMNSDVPVETNLLRLESSKIKSVLGWRPKWSITDAISKTVEWEKEALSGNALETTDMQIKEYSDII